MKQNLLSSAIKVALASTMAFSLQGCLVEGDTNTSLTSAEVGNVTNQVQIANPVGTVVGIVQDIQGNPISGATVSLGGQTMTTGTGGTYQFDDVPVTDVYVNANSTYDGGTSGNDVLGAYGDQLLLTIVPPAGYLGAVVQVTPPAAVIDYGTADECADPSSGGGTFTCNAVNTNTFVDGFIAQAGSAVLPALNATITGKVRDSSTGVAVTNTEVSFEMTTTYDQGGADTTVISNGAFNGVNVSYAVSNLTTTTDANGDFTITGVPSKSSLEPKVAGFTVAALPDNVAHVGLTANSISTEDWTSAIDVGTMMFAPINPTKDTIAPFVTRVDSVTNGNPGLFNDDIDITTAGTGIVVSFNEPLADSVDATVLENSVEVFVWDDTGAAAGDGAFDLDELTSGGYVTPTSITLAADRKSMTVVMPANLTEGQSIHINMLTIDFTDVAGNRLVVNPAASLTYDSSITGASTSNGTFIRLSMSTFVEINKNALAVTGAQQTEDTSGTNLASDALAINAVFADVQDGDVANIIQQLNATDDDGVGAADASGRLTALHAAIGGGNTVDGDQALVSFTQGATPASQYVITIADENGTNVGAGPTITDLAGNVFPAIGTAFTAADSNNIDLVFNNVEAGWTITVTSLDDLGYLGASNSTTLVDNVPPTTVLQTSYGVANNSNYMVTGDTFGDGGELVNVGAVTGGTPYLNVTAQMLDNLDSIADGGAASILAGLVGGVVGNDDNTLQAELISNNTLDATTSFPIITTAYDDAAYTAMAAAAARKIGVAFSEDVTHVTDPTYSGTTGMTGWAALNDVTQQDDAGVINADLMTVDISSVFTLAADDGAVINFTDDVTDSASNPSVAAVNPSVVIRDALPPFITSGSYNGDDVTLVFNEDIVVKNGDVFSFDDGTNAVLSVYPANGDLSAENYTWVAGTNTLTIDAAAWGNDMDLVTSFALPAYPAPSATLEHGTLDFVTVEDANGNDWAANGYGIPFIPYALETSVDPVMAVVTTSAGAIATATSFTVTYTSEHRIDMTPFGVAAGTTTLTAAQVVANFTLAGAGVIVNGGTTAATLSADGRTLTVTVDVTGNPLASADTFDLTGNAGNIDSDWDATQAAAATTVTVP